MSALKLKAFFSTNKQITITSVMMQTQAKVIFCFFFTNANFFLYWFEPSKNNIIWTFPYQEKLILVIFSMRWWLSTPRIITFLAVSLSKLHKPALSNLIPCHYKHTFLSLFFTILVAPNKQFLNLKVLVRFLGQTSKL